MPRKSSPRTRIPPRLGAAFTRAAARQAQVSDSRLRGPDLSHPFHGLYAGTEPATVADRCAVLALAMSGRWAFSHSTGAILLGAPLPQRLQGAELPLHVAMHSERTPPRRAGVCGHRIEAGSVGVVDIGGVPVLAPEDVWCQLSTVLSREDLVAVGDYLLSGDPYDGPDRKPWCSRGQLRTAASRYSGKRGCAKVKWALERVRSGVDSRPESLLRLVLVAAGLPEPLIADATPVDGGRRVLHPDLKLPQWGTVFEYEGDGHRERDQWLNDVERYSLLRAAGWEVIQVTAHDLFRDRAGFLRRVFATLGRRGYRR
ncbi:hypothetical protein [Gryllotalpicola ginsengisoli]|uniref:hypothetical protein n=1 Tax=Gryllotalpicola ginsengisoli TaxID=444608 RepID=UPI0003FB9F41|nr:hypothetical protein [Gryllotalpicola ginsengisoli]